MLPPELAAELARTLSKAAESVAQDIAREDVGDEDDISSQLCGRLKQATDSFVDAAGRRYPNVRIKARHMTSRATGAEERRIGADIVVVLDVDLPDQHMAKGLLIQAKVLPQGTLMAPKAWADLRGQCQRMLARTPAAFVFMYGKSSITPFSASAVESLDRGGVWTASTYSLDWLFHDFLISWIGDRRIGATDRSSLAWMMLEFGIPNALVVQVSDPDRPDKFDGREV